MARGKPRLHRLDRAGERQRRARAAELFARGCTQAEVARLVGVSRMTASRWHRKWKIEGGDALPVAGRTGCKPKLADEELARLEPLLLAGPVACGFDSQRWTLARVAELIRREFGVAYHPSQVQKILNALGWFHRPRGRPKRGAKTGTGPFAWRKRTRRVKGRRGGRPADV